MSVGKPGVNERNKNQENDRRKFSERKKKAIILTFKGTTED